MKKIYAMNIETNIILSQDVQIVFAIYTEGEL